MTCMRLVLVNPHYYSYGKTVVNVLLGRKDFMKYHYFLEYYLKDDNRETALYIDGTKTSFAAVKIGFPFFPKFFVFLELCVWMLLNGINPFKHKIYFDQSQLDPKRDVVVDFARANVGVSKQANVPVFKGMKVVVLTHYYLHPEDIANSLQFESPTLLVSENDLTNVPYFKKHFPTIQWVYQLPFTFTSRFQKKTSFVSRLNKCFALGTIAPIDKKNLDFISFFGTDVLQPMRKTIMETHRAYPDALDSMIKQYENFTFMRENADDSLFLKMVKQYAPRFIQKLVLANQHKKYYAFDVVQKYNHYRMFVCPEENIGLPSTNVFEGMACGSAFFGIDDPMYTNLGLMPGVHYVAYAKDDMADLVEKIRYYQTQPEQLEEIARAGSIFVRDRFMGQAVAGLFWKDLETIFHRFAVSQRVESICSFREKPS